MRRSRSTQARFPTGEVPINTKSNQARDLFWLWPFAASDGQSTVRVKRRQGSGTPDFSFVNAPTWAMTDHVGAAVQTNGSNSYLSAPIPAINMATPLTVAWWGKRTSGTDLKGTLNIQGALASQSQVVSAYYGSDYNGLIVARKTDTTQCSQCASAITQGAWNHFALTHPGGDTPWTIHVNGEQNSTTVSAVLSEFNAQTFTLGRGFDDTLSAAVQVADVRMYCAVLSPGTIRAMYNPQTRWDLYRPSERRPVAAPAAAATYTVQRMMLGMGM